MTTKTANWTAGVLLTVILAGALVIASWIQSVNRRNSEQHPVSFDATLAPKTESERAGYDAGKEEGAEHWSLGNGLPTHQGMNLVARGSFWKHGSKGDSTEWQTGWKRGFETGFFEAQRTNRPSTANAARYDQPSYWYGYQQGCIIALIDGDERERFYRRNEREIAVGHLDKESFYTGNIAGKADVYKIEQRKRDAREAEERKAFEKRSYDAGYAAEKLMHKYNGVPPIQVTMHINDESKQYDSASYRAGFQSAHEEDTRP